jgi:hypothetical protein
MSEFTPRADYDAHEALARLDRGLTEAEWDAEFTRPPQTLEEISPEERERNAENLRRIARVAQATRSAKS